MRRIVGVALLVMACGGSEAPPPQPMPYARSTLNTWMYAAPNVWGMNPAEAWCADAQVAISPSLRPQLHTLALQSYFAGKPSSVPTCRTGAVICGPYDCVVGFRCCGPTPPGDYTIHATIEVEDGTMLGDGIVIFAR